MATKFLGADGNPQKCKKCEKTFEIGSWPCIQGGSHVVESKNYYIDCTVSDPNDLKKCTLLAPVNEGRIWRDANGQEHEERRLFVTFRRGKYETADPMEQWGLETMKAVELISEELWKERFFTPTEKMNQKALDLSVKEARINELLAKVERENAQV